MGTDMVFGLFMGKYQIKSLSIISLGPLNSKVGIQEKYIPNIELVEKLAHH
jgi:hypothetical protein